MRKKEKIILGLEAHDATRPEPTWERVWRQREGDLEAVVDEDSGSHSSRLRFRSQLRDAVTGEAREARFWSSFWSARDQALKWLAQGQP